MIRGVSAVLAHIGLRSDCTPDIGGLSVGCKRDGQPVQIEWIMILILVAKTNIAICGAVTHKLHFVLFYLFLQAIEEL